MKPLIIAAFLVSLGVSIALIFNMSSPEVAESVEPVVQPKPIEQAKSIQQSQSNQQPQKLYTPKDLDENLELYDYDEAWNTMRGEYNDFMQDCYDSYEDDVVFLNECVTRVTSFWLEVEDMLERAYP